MCSLTLICAFCNKVGLGEVRGHRWWVIEKVVCSFQMEMMPFSFHSEFPPDQSFSSLQPFFNGALTFYISADGVKSAIPSLLSIAKNTKMSEKGVCLLGSLSHELFVTREHKWFKDATGPGQRVVFKWSLQAVGLAGVLRRIQGFYTAS